MFLRRGKRGILKSMLWFFFVCFFHAIAFIHLLPSQRHMPPTKKLGEKIPYQRTLVSLMC